LGHQFAAKGLGEDGLVELIKFSERVLIFLFYEISNIEKLPDIAARRL